MMTGFSTVFNVTLYGAIPDGTTKATGAFQKALAACEKAGGGTIYVPAGTFLTGPIHLKRNMNLFLDAGVQILFTNDLEDYTVVDSRWEGVRRQVYISCIYAENAENVSVTGHGTLNGCGAFWWRLHREKALEYPHPKLISFHHCKRVLIQDVNLIDSPSWTINPVLCENITVSGVTICNPANSPNTDGIDPDSCSNVHISNCHIDVGDDCIAIKSGTEDTPERISTSNITITNCTMVHGHGGVVLGSEMSGSIRNVTISNCVFEGTDRGIRMKSRRGRGGVIEDVRVSNVVMHGVICPFVANLYYFCGPKGNEKMVWDKSPYPITDSTPAFRRIHFADITAREVQAAAGFFYGLAEMYIEDVTFDNVSVSMAEDAQPDMPDMMSNLEPMKQKGFFCANVRDFSFNHVTVSNYEGSAFYVENAENILLTACSIKNPKTNDEMIKMINVK
jgi:polygalacturonase